MEKLKKEAGVYLIKNLVNNKIYIGSSKNIYNRRLTHFSKLKSDTHVNKHLQNAYNKYGKIYFVFYVLEYCNEFTEKEQIYIDTLKPNYNIRLIAQNNLGLSCKLETRLKISKTLKLKNDLLKQLGKETLNPKNKDKQVLIDVFDLKGLKIDSLESIKAFARKYNTKSADRHVSKICKNKCGRHLIYQFRYSSDQCLQVEPYVNKQLKIIEVIDGDVILSFSSTILAAQYFKIKKFSKHVKSGKYKKYRVQYKLI